MSLDHVIWDALTTEHAHFAEGNTLAKRYPDVIAPFAATRDTSDAAWRSLEQLILPEGDVALFTPEEVTPTGLVVTDRVMVDCMIGPTPKPSTLKYIELTRADVPRILKLVELTQPGPFRARTIELGRYIGVIEDGELIALSGERMHPRGYTEVSAVCVHPEFRGRGLAAELVLAVSQIIVARGDIPMLHVRADNLGAIALYKKLGFELHHTSHLAVVKRA